MVARALGLLALDGALGLGWSSRWALAMEDREGLRVLEIERSGWVMEKRKSTVLKNEK